MNTIKTKYQSVLKVFLMLVLLSPLKVLAQQEPLYTQYMFNAMSVNPAITGVDETLNMTLLSRLQWAGMDGAPETYSFAAQTPFTNLDMGIGLSLVADNVGPVKNYYFNFNYAYRLQVTNTMKLSFGIKAGIYNYYVGLDGLLLDGASNDPSFQGQIERKMQPNVGAGVYLYDDKFYAGFSVPRMIANRLDNSEMESGGNVFAQVSQHYYIMAGYTFDIDKQWKLRPSFINKMVSGAPPSTDLAVQGIYKDTYWLGASYRFGDAVAILANMKINSELFIGYSYDFTLSELSTFNKGSHEIVISYSYSGLLDKLGRTKPIR
ncbi:PorP/SprF family type IX secretion system membrane protein [Carboxylicivirga sp. N1Y90]|uniref:PorP/SprF family type IX secretion system membrane protein n=1 Tax=Carboxylicivirga fragile TaxID=3417571 RepID=UPI003D3507AB|nr:type IX secretion system membrane protein PorP/SprF [Marinilabiliaceae bacterium N1Y90]